MNKLLALIMAAVFSVSASAAAVTKTSKPATKQTAVKKKQPPTSNVRPAIKKPNQVTNKAVIKKKKK